MQFKIENMKIKLFILSSFSGGEAPKTGTKFVFYPSAEEENKKRIALAKGRLLRPRRIQRDYTELFEKNDVVHAVPKYRAPPGTAVADVSDL